MPLKIRHDFYPHDTEDSQNVQNVATDKEFGHMNNGQSTWSSNALLLLTHASAFPLLHVVYYNKSLLTIFGVGAVVWAIIIIFVV